jgi:hypothetical protein
MIRIGIELNHVVRNINKQILKYYQKDIDPSLDLDDVDEKDDAFKYAKFETLTDKNDFIYIDYPYEIFGCAKTMTKDIPMLMNNWLSELTNYEDDDVEISFFSLNEDSLTIQSTYFFLSKIGTRVRKIVFPKKFEDIKDDYDVIITGNNKLINEHLKGNKNIYTILISNKTTKENENEESVNAIYGSLESVIKDEKLLDNLHKFVNDKNS